MKDEYTLSLLLISFYRFAGYKQFLWWIYNWLGKGFRKAIPSCALWSIREKYPSANGSYIPFKETCDNEVKQLYGDNWCTLRGFNFIDLLDLGVNNEGFCKLCCWHKINPLPCRHMTSFQCLLYLSWQKKASFFLSNDLHNLQTTPKINKNVT